MTDEPRTERDRDDPTPADVRESIALWAVARKDAEKREKTVVRTASLRWYVITVCAAAGVSCLLTVGILWVALTYGSSSGWEIRHSTGQTERCAPAPNSPMRSPRYLCTPPAPPTTATRPTR